MLNKSLDKLYQKTNNVVVMMTKEKLNPGEIEKPMAGPCWTEESATSSCQLSLPSKHEFQAWYSSPLGRVRIISDETRLKEVKFVDTGGGIEETTIPDIPILAQAVKWLDRYFNGKPLKRRPRLALSGTPFQVAVWEETSRIPFGSTVTYAELAQRLGQGRSCARAVGSVLARNPLWLLIPCHRVIPSDGSPGNYAGGAWRKKALLEMERMAHDPFPPPEDKKVRNVP